MSSDSPQYACNGCRCMWGGIEPINKGYEDIKRLKACVGGFDGPSYNFEIDTITNVALTF